MTRWGVFGGLVGAVCLLVVAGCDVAVTGAAQSDPSAKVAATGPVSAAVAFGDATTVDPCSIVDVHSLPSSLHASLEPADAFDDCPVSVTLADGTATDVYVGPLETGADKLDPNPRQLSTLQRGMTLYEAVNNVSGYCGDYLKFQDDYWLYVTASTTDPNGTADTCPASEALTRNAATQIANGTIKHHTFPRSSIGSLDPCTLVTNSNLAGVGLDGVLPLEYPQTHECLWVSNDGSYWLRVLFMVGPEPTVTDPTTESTATLSGRKTVVSQFNHAGTSSSCWARTGLNRYSNGSGGLVEIAAVEMHNGDANMTNACDRAKVAAATAVWPFLPPVTG